jgi:hypothetical protein
MAKLVDNQIEAMPFLPELVPQLQRVIGGMADPEARDVCEKTLEQVRTFLYLIDEQREYSCRTCPLLHSTPFSLRACR